MPGTKVAADITRILYKDKGPRGARPEGEKWDLLILVANELRRAASKGETEMKIKCLSIHHHFDRAQERRRIHLEAKWCKLT